MEQYFKLYKFLFEDEFKNLSIESKVLYSIMLDRKDLSIKNNLIDENGQVYIFMKIEEIKKLINCGEQKAVKILRELDIIGLIKKCKSGFNKPNKIYLKSQYWSNENHNTGAMKIKEMGLPKSQSIKTNINKTENNKTENNNKSGAKAPDKETVFQIPLKDGSFYNLNQQDIDFYKSLYSNIDIEQEIKNIIGWNMANDGKRKTKVGIKKHINTWLSRANQNKGGTNFGASIERQATGSTATNKPTAEDFRELIQKHTTVL